MKHALIAAYSESSRVIGKNGAIPWHYKEDMSWFMQHTLGKTVVMGKNTWQSLPEAVRPLPFRQNIILSSNLIETPANVSIAQNINIAIAGAENPIVFIGGESVYKEVLLKDMIGVMYLTKIKQRIKKGDAFFPEYDESKWIQAYKKEKSDLSFYILIRRC